jgi:hypothetical protein
MFRKEVCYPAYLGTESKGSEKDAHSGTNEISRHRSKSKLRKAKMKIQKPLWRFSMNRRPVVILIMLALNSFGFCGTLFAGGDTASGFTVELVNELGVKATVNVTEFTAGKETWGDREHDFITQELNYMRGQWSLQTGKGIADFANSRLVITTADRQFVLIPWQSFKSLSAQGKSQLIRLKDGSEYAGRLRTILKENSGGEKRDYELSGVTSMTIVQMPNASFEGSDPSGPSKNARWKVTREGDSVLIISKPRFVYSMFHVTSGDGIVFQQNGHFGATVSEQFGVGQEGRNDSTSASINDFESIIIGGGEHAFGMPITVKAKNAVAFSGKFAVTPLGLEPLSNVYLNRSVELAGDLTNGCTIVFSIWRNGKALKLDRIHPSDQ